MKGWMGEFIGQSLRVTSAPGICALPLSSTIVDESLNMLYVVPEGRSRTIAVPKHGLRGLLTTEEGAIDLIGDELRVRPEDRIKRFATRRRESPW